MKIDKLYICIILVIFVLNILPVINLANTEQAKPNGIYKIAVGRDSSKVIEVRGANTENTAIVDIWNYGNAAQQKFYFEYQKEGYYKITAMHTGKSLTAKDNKIEEGTQIVQEEFQGLNSQKWIIRDSKINGWIISPLNRSDLALSVDNTIQNGQNIKLTSLKYSDNEMFYLLNITKEDQAKLNGIYKIAVGKDSSKVIEVKGASKYNTAIVDIWNYGNAAQQKFYFEYQEEGYYKITAMHTGKCLTAKGNNIENGTQIVQEDFQRLNSQKWIIRDSKINGWVISPLNRLDLALSVENTIQNGQNIRLEKLKYNNNQMFYLINISKEEQKKQNGIYKIAVGKESSKVIEVKGASRENTATIDIWNFGDAIQQKFYFDYQKEGYYKITAMHTGKSLTAKDNKIEKGIAIVQEDFQELNSQKWIIRDSKINGWVISPLNRPDLALSVESTIKNGSRIILQEIKSNDMQMYYLFKTTVAVNIDSNKYPGIEERINEISREHPNWKFEILYTKLDFNTAVEQEYMYAKKQANLVYTPTYKGDWIAPNPYISGNWASASYKGIAYFMDPRNFLNNVNAFQFIDLSDYASSGVTLNAIQYQVEGTFLQNNAEDVMRACKNANINPYYALARLFQEQGPAGSSTIYMDGMDGELYFNPFNIGAEVGNDYQTALNKAKKEGWNSMEKGIEGGIRVIKSYYIDKKQNTLYLNKFDVNPASGGGFYNHQYMQNLSAAYSEANILYGIYSDTNVLDNEIKFIVPVYENMPNMVSEKPTGKNTVQYNNANVNCNDRVKVTTRDGSGINVRSGPGIKYGIIRSITDNSLGTRIVTNTYNSDGYWWDEVIFDDGTRGFVATNYLVKIN